MASSSLSDKAKGKQRATEPLRIQDQGVPLPKTLVIRFSEGIPDLTLQVEERDAVRDIKRQVCYIVSECPAGDAHTTRFETTGHN